MNAAELLQEISDYCRKTGLAESTFGRRAVNDGKLTSRLRNGGRITTETLDRIKTFMTTHIDREGARPMIIERSGRPSTPAFVPAAPPVPIADNDDPQRNFRFFDNRQKYLLFVNTCSEKWVVANRVTLELANIHPRPPAVRTPARRRESGAGRRPCCTAAPGCGCRCCCRRRSPGWSPSTSARSPPSSSPRSGRPTSSPARSPTGSPSSTSGRCWTSPSTGRSRCAASASRPPSPSSTPPPGA